jgi:hypothetical protein
MSNVLPLVPRSEPRKIMGRFRVIVGDLLQNEVEKGSAQDNFLALNNDVLEKTASLLEQIADKAAENYPPDSTMWCNSVGVLYGLSSLLRSSELAQEAVRSENRAESASRLPE